MANVFVERRPLIKDVALTWDIAHHLYTRYSGGLVVIVADNPQVLLAALRKQWLKVITKLRKERSSTIDEAKKRVLKRVIDNMEKLQFIVHLPDQSIFSSRGVYIIERSEIGGLPEIVTTLYLACSYDEPGLLIRYIAWHGSIVIYG
jgi:hypothetical protein